MKKNLLLVDDEIELSICMKEIFEGMDFQVFVAHNGKEALDILNNQTIDLVISDLNMPVMDGMTLLEMTRKLGIDTDFIFYSGHGTKELQSQVQNLGALDLLTKPNFSNLESAVNSALA